MLREQRFPCPPVGFIHLGNGGIPEDLYGGVRFYQASGRVVDVPTSENEQQPGVFRKACEEVVVEPVPRLFSDRLAVCLFTSLYRVVDDPEV